MISVDDLIRDLDANPVWAMSLCSKELFHSNLLAWFMDHQEPVRDAIVQAWTEPEETTTTAQPRKVLREYKHLDVVVYTPGWQVLVIENKVFALPDEGQLDAYSANVIAGKFGRPALVLLSLTDPGWPGGCWTAPAGQRWWWRSYDELRALLATLVPAVRRDDRYVGETLSRWLDLLESLQHRLAALGLPADDEPLPLNATDSKLLATARLNAPVQKMRFAHLVLDALPGRPFRAENGVVVARRCRRSLVR
jgi:PD-(D/E)XK nuclease superfamily